MTLTITGTGHAGMLIETGAGSILCDPWVNPAYFASWFPFPDNSDLDWDRLGNCDYLYVSHLHRDHFDAENLSRHVSKKATVLLPEYPTHDLEDELRALGFTSFLRTRTNEPVSLDGGLTVMIQALVSCRFTAARIGQYNEFVYAFFKCLSDERMNYAEAWYAEQARATDDETICIDEWEVQRHCPHLKANLARFARIDDDVLTCQMHGWRFDLPTGRCLTSAGHSIRATRVTQEGEA